MDAVPSTATVPPVGALTRPLMVSGLRRSTLRVNARLKSVTGGSMSPAVRVRCSLKMTLVPESTSMVTVAVPPGVVALYVTPRMSIKKSTSVTAVLQRDSVFLVGRSNLYVYGNAVIGGGG